MNHIKIKKVMTEYGYEENYWCIDGKEITNYLDKCIIENDDEFLKDLKSFNGL